MFTYRQAIHMTPNKIKMNALNVEVANQRFTPDLMDNTGYHDEWEYTCVDPTTDSVKRQVIVRLYHSIAGGGMQDRPVWVHCSCEWFTYNSEYAFALAGSSDIINSNGDWPKIRNPKARPYLCKHLVRVFPLIITKNTGRVVKMENSFGGPIPHESILLQKRTAPPTMSRFPAQYSEWERRYLK